MSRLPSGFNHALPSALCMSDSFIGSGAALSPVRLRALAHLYGVETQPLENASVLEIDCGTGSWLWPIAQAWAHARVVGLCSTDEQCVQARAYAKELGLENLQFYTLGSGDIDGDLGQFDYVFCQQYYNLLAPEAAQFLLQTCEALLSPLGIACIGCEIYPGAKLLETVRDAILMSLHDSGDAEDIQSKAMAALTLFTEGRADTHAFSQGIEHAAELLRSQILRDGVQSALSGQGSPCYFVEFADRAMQAGLHCIGDAYPSLDIAALHGNHVSVANSLLALGQPAVMRQQFLDFSTGRMRRHSLLVGADRGATVAAPLHYERLGELNWACAATPVNSDGLAVDTFAYQAVDGTVFQVENPVEVAMLNTLCMAWPITVSFSALQEKVRLALPEPATEIDESEGLAARIKAVLQNWLESGASSVLFSLGDGPYDRASADKAKLLPVVRTAFNNKNFLPEETIRNLWHQPTPLKVDGFSKEFLCDLAENGLTSRTLNTEYYENKKSRTTVQIDGQETWLGQGLPVTAESIAAMISMLRRQGWVVGRSGWARLLHDVLRDSANRVPAWGEYVVALNNHVSDLNGVQAMPVAGKTPPQVASQLTQAEKLLREGNFAQADFIAAKIVEAFPEHAEAWAFLADARVRHDRYQEALHALVPALFLTPAQQRLYSHLLSALIPLGRQEEFQLASIKLLMLGVKSPGVNFALGNIAKNLGYHRQADAYFRREIEINPNPAYSYLNLASNLLAQGDHEAAESVSYEGLKYANSYLAKLSLHHSHLYARNYSVKKSASEVYEGYKRFDQEVCMPHRSAWRTHKNNKNMNRKLRVGYVSADFLNHSVSKFLEPLLANHDKEGFEIYAYANQLKEDEFSERYKSYVDRWTRVLEMSDDELSARIRADNIDILVDVSGHTAGNRLAVFARKPAPVSLTWLGYGYTTGVSAIDYFLGDQDLCPEGSEEFFAEKPWRLSVSNYVYRENWDRMGDVGDLPALEAGCITFGTLTRSLRINDAVIDTWCELLKMIPGSRLMVNSSSYRSVEVCDDLVGRFVQRGISANRLLVAYRSPPWDSLRKVDIGLDCFPHNSGTTLFDTLCMGIPYVTLAGRPGVGRIGSSILRGAGHPEWIAHTREEYLGKLVALAQDLPALSKIRAGLRDEMRASPLMDELGFARKVEDAYRDMFRVWVEGGSVSK